MITLTWLPDLQAYAVRRNGHMVGLVRFKWPVPFRHVVQLG
jgi:hypothetical protein